MTIVSTDAGDTFGGNGVNSLQIHYLDANGDAKTETVNMNGLTGVNTVATDIRFVQYIHSLIKLRVVSVSSDHNPASSVIKTN